MKQFASGVRIINDPG